MKKYYFVKYWSNKSVRGDAVYKKPYGMNLPDFHQYIIRSLKNEVADEAGIRASELSDLRVGIDALERIK